ncbi:MAG: hypothetical protein II851_07095 [Bacteroidales bacterium]|nr:hypothetical protein [Bacteroidales bacterium]
MKRFVTTFLLLCAALLSFAQNQQFERLYLFPDFTVGHIQFYNGSTVNVKMNFDARGQKIYYYDGETLMEMTNLPAIKTLTVQDRIFVVREGLLCEVFDNEKGPVLVNWKFKNVNKGSKGALGTTTQGKVEVLSSLDFGHTTYSTANPGKLEGKGVHSAEVWERKNDNTYFVPLDDQWYRIKTLKDLYTAFPAQAAQLKSYAKSNYLTMIKAEDAFKIIDYLQTLLTE